MKRPTRRMLTGLALGMLVVSGCVSPSAIADPSSSGLAATAGPSTTVPPSPPAEPSVAPTSAAPEGTPSAVPATHGPSPSSAATGKPTPSPVPDTPDAAWRHVTWKRLEEPFAGEPRPRRLDGLLRIGTGFMAYGLAWQPGRDPFDEMGAVFLSDDGERWRTVLIDDGVPESDASEIILAAAGERGVVLFGGTCCGTEELAGWYSPDGERWSRVALPPSMDRLTVQLSSATALPDGFVVTGRAGDQAAIWTSTDGHRWQPVPPQEAGLGRGEVVSVAAVAGRWLAAGWQDDGETYDGALWESADGFEWRRARTPDLFTGPLDTALGRLVVAAEGVLLMGAEGPHEERVQCERLSGRTASVGPPAGISTALSCGWGRETHWWSIDGEKWEPLPPVAPAPGEAPLPAGRPAEYRLLVAGGPGLVNLGEQSGGGLRTWISRRGRAWAALDEFDPLRSSRDVASGIVVDGHRLVVVGDAREGGSQPGVAAIWIGWVD